MGDHVARRGRGPSPDRRPDALRHALDVAAGAAVFLVINAVLYVAQCENSDVFVRCRGEAGANTWTVLVIGGLVIAAAFADRGGRRFATGFFGALATLMVLTVGACTPSWVDPIYTVQGTLEPYRLRWVRSRELAATRRAWIAALNGRAMDVARGVGLAGAVVHCAQTYRQTEGRAAASEDDLAARCEFLRNFRASADADPPVRYVVPIPRGTDAFGEPTAEIRGDAGWRVTYTVAGLGFAVDVSPDEQLVHRWPRVHADGATAFGVQPSAASPLLPVTPVADLQTLSSCLKGIPEEEDRMRAQHGGLMYGWHLTSMAGRLCPSLSSRLAPLLPSDSNATMLSVLLPVGPDGASMDVARYTVRIVLRDPRGARFGFDLAAGATAAGLPRYMATFEGVVHRTMEPRAATTDDPIVK